MYQYEIVLHRARPSVNGTVRFDNNPEEPSLLEVFYMREQNYIDLGSPSAITLTVVPDDTLNTPKEI